MYCVFGLLWELNIDELTVLMARHPFLCERVVLPGGLCQPVARCCAKGSWDLSPLRLPAVVLGSTRRNEEIPQHRISLLHSTGEPDKMSIHLL